MKVETARGAVAVEAAGSGPDVVLLHSLALSGEIWQGLLAHLSPTFRVCAFDARGHGGSDWDGEPFTVEDLAEDVVATADALGLERFHLVGLSMGGSTAIVVAATHPQRVAQLVLADATANYGPDRVAKWEERAQSVLAKPREEHLAFQLDRWLSPGFLAAHPEEAERLSAIFVRTEAAAHAAACRALGAFAGDHYVPSISADTLVIVGSEDYATPPAMARALAERLPRATYLELPGVRHMSVVEHAPVWDDVARHLGRG